MATSVLSVEGDVAYSTSYYADINNLEVIKGYARWDSNFSLAEPDKASPDTFFSGQIDEVVLYDEIKSDTHIEVFNKSVRDELISYT